MVRIVKKKRRKVSSLQVSLSRRTRACIPLQKYLPPTKLTLLKKHKKNLSNKMRHLVAKNKHFKDSFIVFWKKVGKSCLIKFQE